MRVGIVGAGMAGLAAARTLKASGHKPVLFEQTGAVGGRVATRQVDQYIFDTGATSIAPRGRSIEPVMLQELDRSDLVLIQKPIFVHTGARVSSGDVTKNNIERYTYRQGNAQLPRLLAEDLDVRLDVTVASIEKRSPKEFMVHGEIFDAVILTAPGPESDALLRTANDQRSLSYVSYRKCLSVLLGYDKDFSDVPYHAIIEPEQRHPLTWLSIETEKCEGRAPEGHTALVAQLSPQYSAMHYESEDGAIVGATIEYMERLYGETWGTPIAFDVKRWMYSQPENLAMFDSVNAKDDRLIVASDCLLGGRVEYAYEVGVKAAKILINQ